MGITTLIATKKLSQVPFEKPLEGLSGWSKCHDCQEMVHQSEWEKQLQCCPYCHYHHKLTAAARIELLVDAGTFRPLHGELRSKDPLRFVDKDRYADKLFDAEKRSQSCEAVVTGLGEIEGQLCCIAVMNFDFMGGSMGSVVGEKLTLLIELATEKNLPLIIVSASGGARMQESIFSLMQMAKTSQALAKHHEKGLFYLSILTHPTMGGVTASFASLGDVIIAEPQALIGFAGPRVIEQTIGQQLPKGAQRAEFLLEHGMIDAIVPRREMKQKVAFFLRVFKNA